MSARLSDARPRMFWPTMMTESITNWMNVWLSHWISVSKPPPTACGRTSSARAAEAEAAHIVPTTVVRTRAILPLGPTFSSVVFGGPVFFRLAMCGCGTCSNVMLTDSLLRDTDDRVVPQLDRCPAHTTVRLCSRIRGSVVYEEQAVPTGGGTARATGVAPPPRDLARQPDGKPRRAVTPPSQRRILDS